MKKTFLISLLFFTGCLIDEKRIDRVTQYAADGKVLNTYIGHITYCNNGECVIYINDKGIVVTGTFKVEYGIK